MEVTFLGTGASHGVPVIGCDCEVCRSNDAKNKRYRSAVLIDVDGVKILVDTPPELRLQVVRENIDHVNAVVYTHSHADHFFGLDEVRKFNEYTKKALDCYASANVNNDIRRVFDYIFKPLVPLCSKPLLNLIDICGSFCVDGVDVVPIPIMHGKMPILGFRVKNFAYLTDCSYIPPQSTELLYGLDTLALGAFRYNSHPTHFTVDQAVETFKRLGAKRLFLTHMSHRIDYNQILTELPENIHPAYDGLKITIGD